MAMTALTCLMVALVMAYVLLLLWYLYGWAALPEFASEQHIITTKTTVVIAARNEANNIGQCLQSLLAQDFPLSLLEIIVVNDHSGDETETIVCKFPQVQLLSLPVNESGKKAALTKGINQASGNLIVTTDADCTFGTIWLKTMVTYYEQKRPMMLAGPVHYETISHSPLQIWQAFDLAGMMGVTAASMQLGVPQMCNGANLAFTKKTFFDVGGYSGIDHIPTGDDILLMLKMKQTKNSKIAFIKSAKAIVYTQPIVDIKILFQQRLRWISKATAFSDKRLTLILLVAYLYNALLLLCFIAAFFIPIFWLVVAWLYTIKLIIDLPLVYQSLQLCGHKRLLVHLPWVQMPHVVYVVLVGPAAILFTYNWKGRRY